MKRYRYINDDTLYVHVGTAMPAGTARDQGMPQLEVYQHPQTGELYYRTVVDFQDRMTEVPAVVPSFLGFGQRTFEREYPAMSCCEACCKKAINADLSLMFHRRMILCQICGNKRCPKAVDHLYQCTGSNAVGQVGVLEK